MAVSARLDLGAAGDSAIIDQVLSIAGSSSSRAGSTRVISVDGRSGAGKSTFAQLLAGRSAAPIVSLDHLYGGWDGLQAGIERLCSDVLEVLARDRDPMVPNFDWLKSEWTEPWSLRHGGLVIVEGVGAAARLPSRWSSATVWLEAPGDVRRERAIGRDGDSFEPHWERWAAQEAELLARDPISRRADLILETA